MVPQRNGSALLADAAGNPRTRTLRRIEERGSWDKNLLVKSVEDYHASFMSIHWWPRILLEENRDAIDRINRRIGYRLQVSGISWPESVKMGEPLEIRSAWSNAGVAPCYRGGHRVSR